MTAKKPKRARTERRRLTRDLAALARDAEKLFLREPGGSPEHPIDVESASVVESRARGVPCPRCSGEHAVLEHASVTGPAGRLREVKLECRSCGSKRSLFFRLPVLN